MELKKKVIEEYEKNKTEMDISLCNGCNCMTHSIRKGRALFVCGKCGHNKTFGDVFQYEAIKKLNARKGSKANNGK